ncbi:MAG: xanthine dehydrogenase accessory protein XdhC [Pseudomonadota bacterium]
MRDWVETAREIIASGQCVISISVSQVRGSAPREVGTTMLVSVDQVFGTIGGGRLEFSAIETAHRWLDQAETDAHSFERRIPLGSGCGQCCGGVVTLNYQRWSAEHQPVATDAAGNQRLDVVIFGAGHVGRALAQVLNTLDANVLVVDSRPDQLALLPEGVAAPLLANRPVDAIPRCPDGASVVVMTHDHDLDLSLCEHLLQRCDWRYLGLIGSRTKARRFHKKLRAAGFSESDLSRLICPIGLPGLTGKHPGEIAVAVTAQILQTTRQHALQGVA